MLDVELLDGSFDIEFLAAAGIELSMLVDIYFRTKLGQHLDALEQLTAELLVIASGRPAAFDIASLSAFPMGSHPTIFPRQWTWGTTCRQRPDG